MTGAATAIPLIEQATAAAEGTVRRRPGILMNLF